MLINLGFNSSGNSLKTINVSDEDIVILSINMIGLIIVVGVIYKNYLSGKRSESYVANISNPFCILGDGAMSYYYKPVSLQQKTQNTKKKMMKNNITNSEKANGINELQCNICGSSVKVSYQYTLYKLIN